MKICMLTSHIPPYQSANAILPQLLASKLKEYGHEVSFIIPQKALSDENAARLEYPTTIINIPDRKKGLTSLLKLDSLSRFFSIYKQIKPAFEGIDILHIHSNGILHQTAAITAKRLHIPVILTHYGTEIWHYKKKWFLLPDLFKHMNKISSFVTYYSKMLMDYSFEAGIIPKNPVTIYPPAGDEFKILNPSERNVLRNELGVENGKLLVNVKRLHPLGGHEYLIKAMPEVLKKHPDTKLFICGGGGLQDELERLKDSLGLNGKVILKGMVNNESIWKYYAAADLYVLSSVLEALPTVVVEALACGTPVVMTETPGGKELVELFPDDINLVELRNPDKLAEAIIKFLSAKRRVNNSTSDTVAKLFRTENIYKQYMDFYKKAAER